MRKISKVFIGLIVVALLVLAFPACSSSAPTTNNSSVNLQQMANDIDNLKSSFSILNTAFNNISSQVSSGGVPRAEFDALMADFNALQAQVDDIEIPQDAQVTQEDIDALEAQIDGINLSVLELTAQVSALNDGLAVAQQDIDALQTAVEALQTTIPPTTTATVAPTVSNSVELSIRPISSSSIIEIDGTNITTAQTFLIALQIKNNASVNFTNVQLLVPFYTNINLADVKTITLSTLMGGTIYWQYAGGYTSGFPFICAPIIIAANSNVTYTLQVSITMKNVVTDGAYLYPMVSVVS
jgi:outer membrane murein-binding lipoprotein Lpp